MKSVRLSPLSASLILLSSLPATAVTVMPTGTSVSGLTTTLTLTAGDIIPNGNGNTVLSNSGGNLVVDMVDNGSNSDFFMQWSGAGDGLGFNAATYPYVQVDIASTSAGLTGSGWQIFWTDNDSGIGGANNSSTNFGPILTNAGGGFSFVLDLTGAGTTGAKGWGPGTVNNFRFDPFQSPGSYGESFTISAITFGSETIPEPTSTGLAALGLGLLVTRRRRG